MLKIFVKYSHWFAFIVVIRWLVLTHKCIKPVAYKMIFGEVITDSKAAILTVSKKPRTFVVVFNPYKHYSLNDCIVSAYHEFRHLQQRYKYGNEICDKWSNFSSLMNFLENFFIIYSK